MSEMFRADALRRLRDPQHLDAVIRLTSPASWLVLLGLAVIVLGLVAWGIWGTLSFRAHGLGMIQLTESAVFDLAAPTAGRVKTVTVAVGDQVKAGDQVAMLSLPEAEAERVGAQRRLDALREQRRREAAFLERDLAQRRANTKEQIDATRQKRQALAERLAYLEDRARIQEGELARRLITRQQFESTRDQISQTRQDMDQADIDIARLGTSQAEFASQRRQTLDELDQRIIEAEASLAEAEARASEETVVESPVDGLVTALNVRPGQRVEAGAELATVQQNGQGLVLNAYMPLAKGKRVAPGMDAQVSPTFVERDIYGSIRGRVVSVGALPADRAALMARLGNDTLVQTLLSGGAPIPVVIALETDPSTVSGLDWSTSAGPPVPITPGTEASVAVTTRRARPVDLVVPLSQTWLGLGRDGNTEPRP
jgi:HlyD family secretion protein